MSVSENIKKIRAELAEANPNVSLVAVSKTKPLEMLQEAYDAGQRIFGENYVMDKGVGLVEKVPALPKDIEWHMIGPVQSNKIKKITDLVNQGYNITIETIDTPELARQFNDRLQVKARVMIEVHSSDESSKAGCAPKDVVDLARYIHAQCPNLEMVGLMTIGDPSDPESGFKIMAQLKKDLVAQFPGQKCLLSMGMSADFKLAIQYGSDYVRIGTAIFGARNYPSASVESK